MQGVQVKLRYPSTVRAIPEHLRDASCGGAIQIDYLTTFAFTYVVNGGRRRRLIQGQDERSYSGNGEYDQRDVIPRLPHEHRKILHRLRRDAVRAEDFTTTTEIRRILPQTCTSQSVTQ